MQRQLPNMIAAFRALRARAISPGGREDQLATKGGRTAFRDLKDSLARTGSVLPDTSAGLLAIGDRIHPIAVFRVREPLKARHKRRCERHTYSTTAANYYDTWGQAA